MDISNVIITLGGMATAGLTLVGIAHALQNRRKCDCQRMPEIERINARLDNGERDSQRAWGSIQELYGKSEKARDLYHEIQVLIERILGKIDR